MKATRYFREQATSASAREAIDRCIKFLAKQANAGRMDYKRASDIGHAIGTGAVEAAAKTLVNTRMKRAGSRYDAHGGQTVLTFRAAVLAGRFLWSHLHASGKSNAREAAFPTPLRRWM